MMVVIDTCILIDHSKEKLFIDDNEFKNYYVNSIVQLELKTTEKIKYNQKYALIRRKENE